MIRTVAQARALLRRVKLLPLTAVGELPCLVGEIAGEVEGSWWGHPEGKRIFAVASGLEDAAGVLQVKLLRGKVTFVDEALWPELLRAATAPELREAAVARLPAAARTLLGRVERAGELTPAAKDRAARTALEARLLCLSRSVHGERGAHQTVLTSWQRWAPAKLCAKAAALTLDQALSRLSLAAGGERLPFSDG